MSHPGVPIRTALLALLAALLAALAVGAATASAQTVTVHPGDTLGAIAARNGTTVAALARANGIADPDVLHAGQTIVIGGGGGGSASGGGGGYTVRPGDTLGAIAARSGTSVAALAAANGIANPALIRVGQVLRVPSGGVVPAGMAPAGSSDGGSYTVRSGDTLAAIAGRFGTSADALATLNGIANPNVLSIGRVLRVPGSLPSSGGGGASAGEVAALLGEHAARYGVDPSLARAIAWQESRWNQGARSHAGAIGVMQLMPGTARWLGRDVVGRRLDPHVLQDNIEGGVAYLAWLSHRSRSERQTIGAYYQGLQSLADIGPYDDTKDYVRSVLAFRGRV
ncbi:MAG TPA: LysM peptidoglycan-binding domain-containing protein [Miltoncostaea sp.]|nr:LysM peptidoglycan-binding domain-containing protein [Miltoncostaea sp.]